MGMKDREGRQRPLSSFLVMVKSTGRVRMKGGLSEGGKQDGGNFRGKNLIDYRR